MSRFCGNLDPTPILEAASRWQTACLQGGGALFSDEAIWTPENVASLEEHFGQHPDAGDRSFIEKLQDQLADAPPAVSKLAGEILWLMLLCSSNIGPTKKRETIGEIYAWSGTDLPEDHPLLADEVLSGIGSSGAGYNTRRNRELLYAIEFLKRFYSEPGATRDRILSDGWAFSEWLEPLSENESLQLRHMLLFLLFPDDFERVFTRRHRRQIVAHFSGRRLVDVRKLRPFELDRLIAEARRQCAEEYGTDELDFYTSPLIELWRPDPTTTYLLTWNPSNWDWETLAEDRARTAKSGTSTHGWSCANTKAAVGDQVYLLKTGTEPRGVVAAGNIVRGSYAAPHWDPERAAKGEDTTFVDVDFTSIRDVATDDYIAADDLDRIKDDSQTWHPQQSGIEVKRKAAAMLDKLWKGLAPVALAEQEPDSLDLPAHVQNLILYGPPGTGKTYRLNQLVRQYTDQSVSPDEWRDSIIEDLTWFETIAAALYERGGEGTVSDLLDHPFVKARAQLFGRTKGVRNQVWASLQAHARLDSKTVHLERRMQPYVVDKGEDGVWSFVDDWRTECADILEAADRIQQGPAPKSASKRRYEFVTFHQAYSYEDFVEGIRPQEAEGDEGNVSYSVQPGVFRRICRAAKNDPSHLHAIFIDEINRGNIAKILGELITLIEPDKRAVYDAEGRLVEGMEVTLPYSGDRFSVPRNLDIIATMNTADRSIALLDTALRRRFTFEELMPDAGVISGASGSGEIPAGDGDVIDLRALLTAMNRRIQFLLGRDQMLGHAYFTAVKDFPALKRVMTQQVIPLLQEYFYDDWHRIQLVLRDVGPSGEPLEPQLIGHRSLSETEVLGIDHTDYDDVIDYWIAPESEITPSAIRKVYETD